MVLGLCRRFLRDPRDIEDAFQATFLVLVRKAPAIRDGGLLANWLYGVALRIATRSRANVLRRRHARAGHRRYRSCGRVRRCGRAGNGTGARSRTEPAASEVSCSAGAVLLARSDSRSGCARAALSCRDRSKPDGPRARFAETTTDAPGVRPDGGIIRPGDRSAGTSLHRDGAGAPARSDGRRCLCNRLISNIAGRRWPQRRCSL